MTQKDALQSQLTEFCRMYSVRFPGKRISVDQFDILHEFIHYLIPIEDSKNWNDKKLIGT